jgi:hypothetical protein
MSMKPALLFAVVSLWCLTGPAAESMAQQQAAHSTTTVVQLSYYTIPGMEQEVLSIRLSACDVLEKNGVTRGRVLTRGESSRETKNADNPDPDVVWEGDFPDEASLKRYEEIADKHPDFIAARQKMSTVTRKPAERRYYQLHSGR